jgi:tetratricopeptide (TPR) repeat protein
VPVPEQRPRRTFSERPARSGPLRDVDLGDRAMLTGTLVSGLLGLVLGGALAVFGLNSRWPIWVVLLCPFAGAALTVVLARLFVGSGTTTAKTIYNPSGTTTPHRKEYSHAESLAVRGQYEDAITAFELAVSEDPTDPWPYLRVARIYRDHLGRCEDAARWFRRALREAQAPPVVARKELIELYVHKMNQPAKAAPELARMADELAGTAEGEWAVAELKHVKGLIAQAESTDGMTREPPEG